MKKVPPTVQFKPFPKLKKKKGDIGLPRVDVEKLRELYVKGDWYRWDDFCLKNGYNAKARGADWYKAKVNWTEWKRAWVKHHTDLAEEEITPEMLANGAIVAKQRIKYVQDWGSISKNMKALLQHLMNEHIVNAAEDQKNAHTIRMGLTKKRLAMDAEELGKFASAANRIAELEARALLIPGFSEVKPMPVHLDPDEEADELQEEMPEFTFQTIGTTMSANERTSMLAEYFDQFEKPKELPAPVVVNAESHEDPEDPS